MAQQLDFSGNHPGKSKIWRNKLGIYPIKTFFYGHIQYEKKLPYGDFFLLWAMVLKNLDLFVHDFWASRHAIHKSTSIIFTSQLLKFKYKIVSDCMVSTNAKIAMIKRLYSQK